MEPRSSKHHETREAAEPKCCGSNPFVARVLTDPVAESCGYKPANEGFEACQSFVHLGLPVSAGSDRAGFFWLESILLAQPLIPAIAVPCCGAAGGCHV